MKEFLSTLSHLRFFELRCDFLWDKLPWERSIDWSWFTGSLPWHPPNLLLPPFLCILAMLALFLVLKTPNSCPPWRSCTCRFLCLSHCCFFPTGSFHCARPCSSVCSSQKSSVTSMYAAFLFSPHLSQSLVFSHFLFSKALIPCPESYLIVMCFWLLHHPMGPEWFWDFWLAELGG